jgi:hypothetical protein
MSIRVRMVSVLLPVLLVVACGSRQQVGQSAPPSVVVLEPANNQQVPEGKALTIIATAADDQGVLRLELGVDGVLLGTFENPEPEANVPFTAQHTWTATAPGSHSVMVVAYDQAGQASNAAVVNVTVTAREPSAATPAGDVPTGGPGTTPTWTPIAIATDAGPTSTVSPSDTPGAVPPTDTPQPPEPLQPTATSTSTAAPGDNGARPTAPGPITDFEDFGTWKRGDQANGTFTQSSGQVHSGSYAGKLAYDFPTSGNDYVVFLQSHKLGGQPNQVQVWIYGDGKKHYLNVWIKDAKGETWQFAFGQVKHTGWEQMTAWLDTGAAWPVGHIDGPSNGVLDFPIDFRALVLDDVPDSFAGSGTLYVDDVSCASGSAPTATPSASPEPTAATPSVKFWVDDETITKGSCTRLRWDVENVREVYLQGDGVVGQGERKVCPDATKTYKLRVVYLDGSEEVFKVTVQVNP